ncbi:MAG TPA: Na+/H+ antiporter subunit E [Candidatus Methanoperedenaceae archaeon]|nr:Na+/H+ antiporter subunit E [Candidatus Methanoperedenaceae archaeon]
MNSGLFDTFHLSLGVICSFIVAYMFNDLLFGSDAKPGRVLLRAYRLLAYIPWLLYQIALSNWDVFKRVMQPEMPINPQVIKFRSGLSGELALTIFANSITLTPGTVTVDIDKDGTFYVHAIADEPAGSLLTEPPCEMAGRSGYIFDECRKWNS